MNILKVNEKTKNRAIVFASIVLISIGIFNLSENIYAESNDVNQSSKNNELQAKEWDRFAQDMFEQLLGVGLPLFGGAIGVVIQWARSKGLQVSVEAEQYIVSSAQKIVANQSRLLFKKVYANKDLLDAWAAGKITESRKAQLLKELNDWQIEAKEQAITDFRNEIQSTKFKKNAVDTTKMNIEKIIENTFTQNQIEKSKRAKELLMELVPVAIDSALLYERKRDFTDQEKMDIIDKAFKAVVKQFDFEYIIADENNAKMHLEAELANRLEK